MGTTSRVAIALVLAGGLAVVFAGRDNPGVTAKHEAASAAFSTSLDKLGHDAGVLYGIHCDRAKLDSTIVDQGGGNLAFRIRCYNPEDVGTATGAIFRFTGAGGGAIPNIELVSR